MDKLVCMRAFVRVVELGSFARAARELRLSRSVISKYILDLEQDLGVQLLSRTTRSISTTQNGQEYYARCTAILGDIADADRAAAQLQDNPRGILRINAPMSFGTLVLGKALADFIPRYPDLKVQLVLSDQQVDTVQEGFDVTIRIADLQSSSLIARAIVPARRLFCASPGYLAARGAPSHPEDLRLHECLSYGYLGTGLQWKLTGADGDHWIAVPWRLCSNNAEVLRDLAVAGHGIALLPTFIAAAELNSGRLQTVLDDFHAPPLTICALYPPTRHLAVKVRVLIDFLVERFAHNPAWDGMAV
ncbi:LysR substrate-binding domain-containing protein [Zavarzinia sp. CC-PAN008]|uniref:LysR family transcriptional regulator n=1 Tax=Zavarzinia sp. CC-PAN008 TaxID=3243332 RepID=UPI003F743B27